ncbi:Ba170 [Baboon cytomegalovirus]|nr:Ba170 [Baboon cytomegalovirus]
MDLFSIFLERFKLFLRRLTNNIQKYFARPPQNATIKIRTTGTYTTSDAGVTYMELILDLSDLLHRRLYLVDPLKFSLQINNILAKEVSNILQLVKSSGKRQTAAEVLIYVTNCPVGLASVLDSEHFSRTMDVKLQAAMDSVMLRNNPRA